ncbi:MAG: pseudouridine synthase [Bacteroidota bacterium]
MPKRNSSGASSGRRRTGAGGGKTGSRAGKSAGRNFRKSDNQGSRRASFNRDENSSSGNRRSDARGTGYRKNERGERGNRQEGDSEFSRSPKRSYGKRGDSSASSYKRSSGSFRSRSEGQGNERDERGEKRGRTDRGFSKPGKRSYSDRESSSKRPLKKFDRASGRKEGDENARPRRKSFGDSDSSPKRPYKKFDRKEGEDSDRSRRKSFGDRGDSSSSRPYKKFDRKGGDTRPRRRSDGEEKASFFKKKTQGREGSNVQPDTQAPEQTGKIRLNKYISNSGVCSRREADELITMGLISVNGKTITELGYKVNPGDEVRYEDKVLKAEKPVYILLNKPKGFLTTTDDPHERNTVMHLVANAVKERIYPVGRLDRNTTGLLLLTNDGDLADKLMHPSHNVRKIYKVELDRPLTKADFQTISEGVLLEEGRAVVDDLAIISEDNKTVGIELHIGWNRVVRRIFESLQYEVVKLDRSVYAGLDKKDLSRGQWRFLTKEEVVRLKHF